MDVEYAPQPSNGVNEDDYVDVEDDIDDPEEYPEEEQLEDPGLDEALDDEMAQHDLMEEQRRAEQLALIPEEVAGENDGHEEVENRPAGNGQEEEENHPAGNDQGRHENDELEPLRPQDIRQGKVNFHQSAIHFFHF